MWARSSSQLVKDGRPYCSDGTLTGELCQERVCARARGFGGGVWIGSIERHDVRAQSLPVRPLLDVESQVWT
ncbi:hypothetical protein CGCSCA4_v005665 [Colletotrichum siamense]|uniref:Uncharacterized protein n=1 Tax=Colletotrichum siamense TaxID=690259 RepID=A0A9P5EVY0_COLSI|nr:hypothetical protein CGCSCA4_v005665 [Colletotrichum siamense]KAF4860272.1 hypothetical protein CGCSCA2_v005713 [Colletotrichum siamense]